MTHSPSTSPRQALSAKLVERLFAEMSAMYGKHFAAMWESVDPQAVKDTWARRLGDLTREEIAAGLMRCETRKFPPTLPEFRALCRHIDHRAAFNEAVAQLARRRTGDDCWSRPGLFWAAQKFGPFDLLNSSYTPEVARRWEECLEEHWNDPRPIPAPAIALPKPGEQTVTNEEARRRIADIAERLAKRKSINGAN